MLRLDVECERLLLLRNSRLEVGGKFTANNVCFRALQPLVPRVSPVHSLQRRLAHLVAAHYGLSGETAQGGEFFVLLRTPAARIPPARLSDVADDSAGPGGGSGRLVGLMRRGASGSTLGGPNSAGQQQRSVEEREAEYERARQRILGVASAAEAQPAPQLATANEPLMQAQPSEQQPPQALERRAAAPSMGGGAEPALSSGEASSSQRPRAGRALLRSPSQRAADMMDPDFVRPPSGAFLYAGGSDADLQANPLSMDPGLRDAQLCWPPLSSTQPPQQPPRW